jgi:hypothetical protein
MSPSEMTLLRAIEERIRIHGSCEVTGFVIREVGFKGCPLECGVKITSVKRHPWNGDYDRYTFGPT